MTRNWRPSLALVLGGGLAGTLALSFAGLVTLRYLGPTIGFRNAAILLALAITAATAGLGWLLVRLLLRPIHALEHYAQAQEQATPPAPPAHFGTRELHATATRVIAMAETLRDREATIRAFTDHVTHELRTPVAAIRAASELLDEATLTEEDRGLLAQIDGARAQMETQLAALRDIARAREARYLGKTSLALVLPDLSRAYPGLTLMTQGEDLALPLASAGLALILGHLLRNAAEHGATEATLRADAEGLLVEDNGSGISAGNAERIFAPFFTTRRDSGGTGMGLTLVRNLLQAHHATIRHLPTPKGTTFRITFEPAHTQ
jgi:two-component system OmpR family sensor kinase